MFTPDSLERLKESCVVDSVEFVVDTDSTNNLAMKAAPDPEKAWRLFLAERQTAGRGRRGNVWWSNEGALMFSLRVDTAMIGLAADRWPFLSLAVGLGVREALSALVPDRSVMVKWPNDVYADDYKVSGILVEQCPDEKGALVLGVGINLNQQMSDAPAEIRETAASIAELTAVRHDACEVLAVVIAEIRRVVRMLQTDSEMIIDALSRASYLTGRRICVETDNATIIGTCVGIDTGGALLVRDGKGVQRCLAGTVSLC